MTVYRVWLKYNGRWQHQSDHKTIGLAEESANSLIKVKGVSSSHVQVDVDRDGLSRPERPKHLIDTV